MMSAKVREHLIGAVKYLIGFGLLAWIISVNWSPEGKTGLKQLLARPIDVLALLLAAILMAATVGLQIFRWFVLVRALDLPFTLRNAYRLGLVGYYYNTVLPGSIGGDLLKGYFIAKEQKGRRAAAIATVLIDRAMGLFGLILFVAVSGSIAWGLGNEQITQEAALQRIVKVMVILAAAIAGGYLLLGLLPPRRADRFAGRLRWIPKLGNALAEAWYAVWTYRQRPGAVLLGVGITAVAHAAMMASFYFASRSFAADNLPTLPEILVIAPIGFIVQALPVSPGGVGVGEAAFAYLFKVAKRSEESGLAARLALRLVEWGLGALGYLVYLRMKKELPLAEVEQSLHQPKPAEADDFIATEAKIG